MRLAILFPPPPTEKQLLSLPIGNSVVFKICTYGDCIYLCSQ